MKLLFAFIIFIVETVSYESFSQLRSVERFMELNAGTMLPVVKASIKVNPLNKVYLGLSYYFQQNEAAEYSYKAYSIDMDFHFKYDPENNRLGRFYIANRLFYETQREPGFELYAWYLYFDVGRYFYILPSTGLKIEAGIGKFLDGRVDISRNSLFIITLPAYKMDVEISFFYRFGAKKTLLPEQLY